LWQESDAELEKPINMSLAGFQRDLACLRQLCQHIPVSINPLNKGAIIPKDYILGLHIGKGIVIKKNKY
jgi:hypothetical protein